jgi:hypothetical protein
MKVPSNKISILLLICVIAAVLFILGDKGINALKEKIFSFGSENKEFSFGVDLPVKTDSKDTDGDGLFDWQENIWGTSINNPDSDGDGTNDGEEVKNDRDPLIKGPDDKYLNNEQKIIAELTQDPIDQNSLTAELSREIFTQFNELRSTGSLDENAKLEIANQAIEKIEANISIKDVYNENDLVVVPDTAEAFAQYMNKMKDIQDKSSLYFVAGEDPKKIAAHMYLLAAELVKSPVPLSIKNEALVIVNGFYKMGKATEIIIQKEDDPVFGLGAYKTMLEIQKQTTEAALSINTQAKQSDIIYDEKTSRFTVKK